MKTSIQIALLAAGILLCGCFTEYKAFDEAKAANTPEAYHAFLEQHPDAVNRAAAEERIDGLEWEAAEAENTAEAYQSYLIAHPEGKHATEAELAAPKLAWQDADYSGDLAKVQAFLERYGRSAYSGKANKRAALLDLAPKHVEVGPTRFAAEEGDKWTVSADVKNVGAVDVVTAKFRVAWKNGEGRVVRSKEWYLVVEPKAGYDAADELTLPLPPEESRTFSFTFRRREAADDWVEDAEHVALDLVELKLAG